MSEMARPFCASFEDASSTVLFSLVFFAQSLRRNGPIHWLFLMSRMFSKNVLCASFRDVHQLFFFCEYLFPKICRETVPMWFIKTTQSRVRVSTSISRVKIFHMNNSNMSSSGDFDPNSNCNQCIGAFPSCAYF
jgi:hypothetical protein